MKKLLIFMMLLCSTALAGTEYSFSNLRLESSSGFYTGFFRFHHHMTMTPSGQVIITVWTPTTDSTIVVIKSSDFQNWSRDINALLQNSITYGQMTFYDTTYIFGASTNLPLRVRRYTGTTQSVIDTLPTLGGSSADGRVAMMHLGDTSLAIMRWMDIGSDTTYVVAPEGGWTIVGGNVTSAYDTLDAFIGWTGNGQKMAMDYANPDNNGILWYATANDDLFWWDATNGAVTLTTDLFSHTFNDIDHHGYWIAPHKDSFFVVGYNVSDGGNLCLKYAKKTTANTYSKISDSVLVLSSTYVIAGNSSMPAVAMIGTSDSGVIAYKKYPSAPDGNIEQVCGRLFSVNATSGITLLGDEFIIRADADALPIDSNLVNLQICQRIRKINDTIYIVTGYTDSTTNDQTKFYVNVHTIFTGSATSNSISLISATPSQITTQHTYSGFSGVDTVWSFYDNDATIADADSIFDASSLGSPDTLTATGLTSSTEYNLWSVISYSTSSRDTSSPVTVWTPPLGLLSFALDSLHNDFSAENDSIRMTFTTPATVNADYIIFVFSTSAYQDSLYTTYRDSMAYPGASVDTAFKYIYNGTEGYTLYVSAWLFDVDAEYSPRASDNISFGAYVDNDPPDSHDFIDILWVVSLNPDSVRIEVGTVDSADFDTTMIRWDTSGIPMTISSGNLLWTGGARESNSSNYLVNYVNQPDWVYFSIFAGDTVSNWSSPVYDSIYLPSGGEGIDQSRNIMPQFIKKENEKWIE